MHGHSTGSAWRTAAGACGLVVLLSAGVLLGETFGDWKKKDGEAMRRDYERLQQPSAEPSERAAATRLAPPLQIGLPLPAGVPGGHIVFARLVARSVPVGAASVTFGVPKLFVMKTDGSGVRELLSSPGYESFREPRWAAGHARLLFVSDYQYEQSACMEDIFGVNADGTGLRRITGAQPAAVAAYGSITGAIADTPENEPGPLALTQVCITAQGGGDAVYHPQSVGQEATTHIYRFHIPRVAAGEKIWIKAWKDKFSGSFSLVEVKAGQDNDVGMLPLRGQSLFASKPSLTPDGRHLVGMGSMASWQSKPVLAVDAADALDPLPIISGTDSICAYDAINGGLLIASFEAPFGGCVKDPVLSPDGARVALACGPATQEDLAVMPLQGLLTHQFQVQPLVRGGPVYPSEITLFQSYQIGHATPAWSPDGRQIVFARIQLGTQSVSGNLFVVNVDGSGLRQLTSLAPTQAALRPCFSPDGKRVAFTLLTGKLGLIKPEHLAARLLNADIATVAADGSDLRQLTTDGVSNDAAWGP